MTAPKPAPVVPSTGAGFVSQGIALAQQEGQGLAKTEVRDLAFAGSTQDYDTTFGEAFSSCGFGDQKGGVA